MQTLSYGFKLPDDNDTGDIVFPALDGNITQLNNHTHDGTNSAPLATRTANILHASWSASAGLTGIYEQTITLPAGLSYDVCFIWFKLSTGEYVFPSVSRVSSTSYKVYTSDNTLDYVANYR